MKAVIFRVASFTLLLVTLATPARGVDYVVKILQASGFPKSRGHGGADGIQAGSGNIVNGGDPHAYLWTGTSASGVDLHPAGAFSSEVFAASSDTQVGGVASASSQFSYLAYLWKGTAASAVNLNRPGDTMSNALDVSGEYQVGWGYASGVEHALLWHGTAASVVDLNAPGMTSSVAHGIFGSQIVGSFGSSSPDRAILWNGTATDYVNLHPAGFGFSTALDTDGASQVGFAGNSSDDVHAMLWHGTAASAVDLDPPGFTRTRAVGLAGNLQVGYGGGPATGGDEHALLWNGTALSMIDLHSYLSSLGPTYNASEAEAITPNGTIIGTAWDYTNNKMFAVMWTPVPEPTTGALLVCAAGLITFPRGHRARP